MPRVMVGRARGALLGAESHEAIGDHPALEERTVSEGMRGTWWAGGAQSAVLRLRCCRAQAIACKGRTGFQAPIHPYVIRQAYFSLPPSPFIFKSCCLGHSADTEAGLRFGPGWQTLLPWMGAGLCKASGLALSCGCVALGWVCCSAQCWGMPGPPASKHRSRLCWPSQPRGGWLSCHPGVKNISAY